MPTDIVSATLILNKEAAHRKLRRMAFQVAENSEGESALVVAGIVGNGEIIAQNLVKQLQAIMPLTIEQVTINLNKKNPLEVALSTSIEITGKNILVVDDVANTGKTLLYALKPFLNFLPKKIQTLVLVERSHKAFSVQADYVGLSVTTTLQEHITVETENGEVSGAWLH